MSGHDPLSPPPAFRMEQEPAPAGVVLLVLAGEIDLATSGRFREIVDAALGGDAHAMVVDMADVTFMDSTMLRELLRAHKDIAAAGGRFVLVSPQASVRRLLELTGTTGLFEMAEDRSSALGSATGGG